MYDRGWEGAWFINQGQNTSAWWAAVEQVIAFRDAQVSNAGIFLSLLTGNCLLVAVPDTSLRRNTALPTGNDQNQNIQ